MGTTKAKKLKIAGAVVLIAGGMAIGELAYNQYSKSYDVRFKKEVAEMSEKQLKDAIKRCDDVLISLEETIKSVDINPEERFNARRAQEGIIKRRAEYQKRLDKIMKKQSQTIRYDDIKKTR